MTPAAKKIQTTYIAITLTSTLATSFIWGINTLFLLDAGLSNSQAFAANAFFTVGQVLFEIPTGVIADTWGRRASFLLGAITLLISTLLYLAIWHTEGPLWQWAIASGLLGLGYTFFSGAVEAWLVDALSFASFTGDLESIFARGQITSGIAMLSGSVVGGYVAQLTNLGVPYILRSAMLAITFLTAFTLMKDQGFTPKESKRPFKEMRHIFDASLDHGLRNPPVRWLMLAAPFSAGVGIYAFYALQPYLLELYGDPGAYGIAGLAAAVVASAQIAGGLLVSFVRKHIHKRTTVLLLGVIISSTVLCLIGFTDNFWIAVGLMVGWAIVFALTMPIRQAYLNGLIPSQQRATVLSFDALMGSSGGIVSQPLLGRTADAYSYSASYIVGSTLQLCALPLIYAARQTQAPSDTIVKTL